MNVQVSFIELHCKVTANALAKFSCRTLQILPGSWRVAREQGNCGTVLRSCARKKFGVAKPEQRSGYSGMVSTNRRRKLESCLSPFKRHQVIWCCAPCIVNTAAHIDKRLMLPPKNWTTDCFFVPFCTEMWLAEKWLIQKFRSCEISLCLLCQRPEDRNLQPLSTCCGTVVYLKPLFGTNTVAHHSNDTFSQS